jgi:tRNA threonylcarbamoyladenosine biosynthesis protein TsaB
MPVILNLETATKVCSVSLSKDEEIISYREYFGEYAHAEKLTVFVQQVLKEAQLAFSDLDAVAVSKGPGSYTGLRIGVSAAKGFAFTLEIPLLAVSTLENMALQAIRKTGDPSALYCPMIDARRMEVYCAFYDKELKEIQKTSAEIIDENSFDGLLKTHKVFFFGDGSAKCREVLGANPSAVFLEGIGPSSLSMAPLSLAAFKAEKFENVAYFEPFYLKEFVTTVPKKKI